MRRARLWASRTVIAATCVLVAVPARPQAQGVDRPKPVVDVHTHVFNFHALPNYGILRSKGVPHIVSSATARWLRNHTVSSPLGESASGAGDELSVASEGDDALTLQERQEMVDYVNSQAPPTAIPVWDVGVAADADTLIADEDLVESVLETAGFDGHPAPAGELEAQGLRGTRAFLRTLRKPETEIVAQMRQTYPDVRFFVHHMMDMQRSYGNDKPVVSFERQVARMHTLTRQSGGFLGTFVAFDPFRPDSLKLVQDAWNEGALGVKVYPPSGYRATRNGIPKEPGSGHAKTRWRARYSGLDGATLDERMDALFAWAAKNRVPILTHCTPDGMAAEKSYGLNSDPGYWAAALAKFPDLPLCFGHAGGGGAWAVPKEEWKAEHAEQAKFTEEAIRLSTRYANVYCSLDYIDEVLTSEGRSVLKESIGDALKLTGSGGAFGAKLIYGTDWHMISKLEEPGKYLASFREVFDAPTLSPWADSFFAGNASRFLGLERWLVRLEKLGAASPLDEAGIKHVRDLLVDIAALPEPPHVEPAPDGAEVQGEAEEVAETAARSMESWMGIQPWEKPEQYPRLKADVALVQASAYIHASEARAKYNVTGAGSTVAVLDTGLRTTHADFSGRVRGGRNFTAESGGAVDVVKDRNGHGTHVAGIIVAGDVHTGIAPGSSLVAVKVLDREGGGSMSVIEDALEWVANHRAEFGIAVVNLSLGDGMNHPDDADLSLMRMARLIDDLRAEGVSVVAAAGNGYRRWSPEGQEPRFGMAKPAILRGAISVGAVYDADVGARTYGSGAYARTTASGRITPFSQRLPAKEGSPCATTLFGPGAPMSSSGIQNDRGSTEQSGTSHAAPIVSGVILLMHELHQRVTGHAPTVDEIERWLRAGARTIQDGDDEDDNVAHSPASYQVVDALGALDAMMADLRP